jgi:ATP-dependent Clp protease protease subunit
LLGARAPGRPIDVHLSCPDSALDASLALADSVAMIDAPVHVVVHGTLGGPAVAILCSADERSAHRNALIVLSVPRASAAGSADQAAAQADQYERQVHRVGELVADTTGRPLEDVEAELRAGRVLTAEDAFGQGILTRLA